MLPQRLLLELFAIAFAVCLAVTWFTIVWQDRYVVFTDPDTVPEPTDFFAGIPALLKELWTL